MDAILSAFLNFGVGGVMAGAVVWFLYTITQSTIPAILKKHQEELAEVRSEFLEMLKSEQTACREERARSEARWQRANDAICVRLEAIQDQLSQLGTVRGKGGSPT